MEQQFKMKQIEDALRSSGQAKEDVITIFMALQRQNFVLANSLSNLVKKWPTVTSKDLPTTKEVK
jgi:hypothetical protein